MSAHRCFFPPYPSSFFHSSFVSSFKNLQFTPPPPPPARTISVSRQKLISCCDRKMAEDFSSSPSDHNSSHVHPLAASGFNADQSVYESARPTYPPAVVEFVTSEVIPSLGSPVTASKISVLDLAAGTGKWTRLLFPLGTGRLVAVEPSAGMRKEFSLRHPEVTVLDGSATAIPLPDESLDVIFAAQAFHWFANVAALTEMHRVLMKGGTVVLIWNMEDKRTTWVAKLREAYEKYEAGTPQYRLGLWRRPFEHPEMVEAVSKLFQLPIDKRQFKHDVINSKSDVWQRVLSKSYISVLAPAQKQELKKEIDKILMGEDMCWHPRGESDKVVNYPYTTDVVWFRKYK